MRGAVWVTLSASPRGPFKLRRTQLQCWLRCRSLLARRCRTDDWTAEEDAAILRQHAAIRRHRALSTRPSAFTPVRGLSLRTLQERAAAVRGPGEAAGALEAGGAAASRGDEVGWAPGGLRRPRASESGYRDPATFPGEGGPGPEGEAGSAARPLEPRAPGRLPAGPGVAIRIASAPAPFGLAATSP